MTPTGSWWRRNRLWLALLLPLLLLAVAASSFRLTRLYLPWEWSRPTIAHGPTGTLRSEFLGFDDALHRREVTVQVLSLVAQDRVDRAKALDGGTLWRVDLQLSAAPDQLLKGCRVELVDAAGVRYDHRSGQEPADPKRSYLPPILVPCVPEEAPGPDLAPFTGERIPSPVERPATWRQEVLVAMPKDVRPATVRVMWKEPDYLVLDVPW